MTSAASRAASPGFELFAPMEAAGQPALRVVASLVVLGKQLPGLGVGARGSLELGEHGRLAVADLAVQVGEQRQLLAWVLPPFRFPASGVGRRVEPFRRRPSRSAPRLL
jgi:hypothetical protein